MLYGEEEMPELSSVPHSAGQHIAVDRLMDLLCADTSTRRAAQ